MLNVLAHQRQRTYATFHCTCPKQNTLILHPAKPTPQNYFTTKTFWMKS